jgi:type VI secretion system protein ImpH
VRNYVGNSLDWDVRLHLEARVTSSLRLDRSARLGWTSWLGRCLQGERRQDVILNPLKEDIAAVSDSRNGRKTEYV